VCVCAKEALAAERVVQWQRVVARYTLEPLLVRPKWKTGPWDTWQHVQAWPTAPIRCQSHTSFAILRINAEINSI